MFLFIYLFYFIFFRFDEIFQPHFLNQRRIRLGGAVRFEFFTLGAFWKF